MRSIHPMAAAAAWLVASAAQAQFVKGNEAVRVGADGSRRVELPPAPGSVLPPPCPAERPGCTGSAWKMIETADGLMECTEFYARPGTCRPSKYGKEQRSRVWIVKVRGAWLQCQHPDLASLCVSTKALPFAAVQ